MGISEGAAIDPFLPGKVLKMSAGFVEDAAVSIQAASKEQAPRNLGMSPSRGCRGSCEALLVSCSPCPVPRDPACSQGPSKALWQRAGAAGLLGWALAAFETGLRRGSGPLEVSRCATEI